MVAVLVLLSCEGRNFHLKLVTGQLNELKREFLTICANDSIFQARTNTHVPSFCWKDPQFKGTAFQDTEFEILPTDSIYNFAVISVKWTEKNQETLNDTIPVENEDNGENNIPQSSGTIQLPNRGSTLIPYNVNKMGAYYSKCTWDSLEPYEQQNEAARLEQFHLLKSMRDADDDDELQFQPITSRLRKAPAHKPSSTTRREVPVEGTRKSARRSKAAAESEPKCGKESSNKENNPPQESQENVVRRVPSIPIFFNEEEDADEIESELPTEAAQGTSSSSVLRDKQNVPIKVPKIYNHRKMGCKFNHTNALPKFSNNLRDKLLKGEYVQSHLYLREIRDHINSKKKHPNDPVTPGDYNMVCSYIVKEYPVLGNADDPTAFSELKYSVRKSLSAMKHYDKKGKEHRKAKRANKTGAVPPRKEARTEQTSTVPSHDEQLAELKSGTSTDARTRYLIRVTVDNRNPPTKVSDMAEFILNWPHYKNALLLIYEYSIRENYKLETLYQNAASFLQKLQEYLGEPEALRCIIAVQEKLMPSKFQNDKVKPLISVIEAVLAEGEPQVLEDIYDERAPHVIVTTDYNDDGESVAVAAVSKLATDCISCSSNPSPETIIIMSLAPYFLFNLDFPAAYDSTLRLLEKFVHKKFCLNTSRKRGKKEYKDFLADFEK